MPQESAGSEVSKKIRSAIKAKLEELGAFVDEELPDYIMVMIANKKSRQQMADDLNLFLGKNSLVFTKWLHEILERLQNLSRQVQDKSVDGDKKSIEASSLDQPTKHKATAETTKDTSDKEKSSSSKDKQRDDKHKKKTSSGDRRSRSPRDDRKKKHTTSSGGTSRRSPSPSKKQKKKKTRDADKEKKTKKKAKKDKTEAKQGASESPDDTTRQTQQPNEGVPSAPPVRVVLAAPIASPTATATAPATADAVETAPPAAETGDVPATVPTEAPEQEPVLEIMVPEAETTSEYEDDETATNEAPAPSAAEAPQEENAEATEDTAAIPQSVTGGADTQPLPRKRILPPSPSPRVDAAPTTSAGLSTTASADTALTKPRNIVRVRPMQRETPESQPPSEERPLVVPLSSRGGLANTELRTRSYVVKRPDPDQEAVKEVSSVVKVSKRKITVPLDMQPRKSIFLKAMHEAAKAPTALKALQKPHAPPAPQRANVVPPKEEEGEEESEDEAEAPANTTRHRHKKHKRRKVEIKRDSSEERLEQPSSAEEDEEEQSRKHSRRTHRRKHGSRHKSRSSSGKRSGKRHSDGTSKRRRVELAASDEDDESDGRSMKRTIVLENKTECPRFVVTMGGVDRNFIDKMTEMEKLMLERDSQPDTSVLPSKDESATTDGDASLAAEVTRDAEETPDDGASLATSSATAQGGEVPRQQPQSPQRKPQSPQRKPQSPLKKGIVTKEEPPSEAAGPERVESPPAVAPSTVEVTGTIIGRQQRMVAEHGPSSKPGPSAAPLSSPPPAPAQSAGVSPQETAVSSASSSLLPNYMPGDESLQPLPAAKIEPIDAETLQQLFQIAPVSISLDDDEDEEEIDAAEGAYCSGTFHPGSQLELGQAPASSTSKLAEGQLLSEKCRFWPNCRSRDDCPYMHPSKPCRSFPNCTFGARCLYVHPVCKFDANCSRPTCPFTHTGNKNIHTSSSALSFKSGAVPGVAMMPPLPSASKGFPGLPVPCRFAAKCTKPTCPFQHPPKKAKLCKFGASCTNASCAFGHASTKRAGASIEPIRPPPLVDTSKLSKFKWVARTASEPQLAQQQFKEEPADSSGDAASNVGSHKETTPMHSPTVPNDDDESRAIKNENTE